MPRPVTALLWLPLFVTSALLVPSPLYAQTAYWAPGAVRAVETRSLDDFPDDMVARRWVGGFLLGLQDVCPGGDASGPALRLTGESPTAFYRLANHIHRTVPWALEGFWDGSRFGRETECGAADRHRTTAYALMLRSAVRQCPTPPDRFRFLQLVRPDARSVFGLDSDGLDPEQRQYRDRILPSVAHYLRTRQMGRLGDGVFAATAREVATRIAGSGVPTDVLDRALRTNDDGEDVFRIFVLGQLEGQLRPSSSNPFAPEPTLEERYEEWTESLWREFTTTVTQAYRNLTGQERATEACQADALNALGHAIAEAVPVELEKVFSMSPTRWSPPAEGTTGVVTGRVLLQGLEDRPMEGLRITVLTYAASQEPLAAPVVTDADGRFRIEEVPVPQFGDSTLAQFDVFENGVVSVTAREAATWYGTERVQVAPGATADVVITVECTRVGEREGWCENVLPRAPVAGEPAETPAQDEQPGREEPPRGFEHNPVADLPVPGGADVSAAPTFTPHTVAPELRDRDAFEARLARLYPPSLRANGIGGTPTVWVFIDEEGNVGTTQLAESSGHDPLDQAALEALAEARFTPAENNGAPVPVWIRVPVPFGR